MRDDLKQGAADIRNFGEFTYEEQTLLDYIAQLEAENAAYRDALDWYSRTGVYGEFFICDSEHRFVSDLADWGDRARKALRQKGRTSQRESGDKD